MQTKLFSELGLSPELLKAVEKMGFEKASPIQAEAIPPLLAGRDMVGQSQTGSGKTAAFGLPAIEKVDVTVRAVQVLILCPTRELATQVAVEIAKLAFFKKGVRELPIYGGQSYDRQFRGLQAGPQIVIGTPGRVIDHLERKTLKFDGVRMVVLDEADRMLDMGFREDIEKILESVPPEGRQTVLFSATLPPPIRKIIERFTKDPAQVRIESQTMTVPAIDQSYVEVDWRWKTEALCRLIDFHDVRYGLIFGFTKAQVDELTETLMARGYAADKLHGDMPQAMRERVMKRFRERKFELLVATDVAARGLDVDDLEIVFNYELPYDPEDYVHRIGRTGRAGRSGRAIALVGAREFGRLQQVQRFIKQKIRRESVPELDQLEEKATGRLVDQLRATLEGGKYKRQDSILNQLSEAGHSPGEVASALLHLLTGDTGRPAERKAEERPRREVASAAPSVALRPPAVALDAPAKRPAPAPMVAPRPAPERPPVTERRPMVRSGGRPEMVTLRFNLGENFGVLPGDFVGCIAGESGLPREVIGAIRIQPTVTLVEVEREHVDHILKTVVGSKLKGKKVLAMVSPASPAQKTAVAPAPRPIPPWKQKKGPRPH